MFNVLIQSGINIAAAVRVAKATGPVARYGPPDGARPGLRASSPQARRSRQTCWRDRPPLLARDQSCRVFK